MFVRAVNATASSCLLTDALSPTASAVAARSIQRRRFRSSPARARMSRSLKAGARRCLPGRRLNGRIDDPFDARALAARQMICSRQSSSTAHDFEPHPRRTFRTRHLRGPRAVIRELPPLLAAIRARRRHRCRDSPQSAYRSPPVACPRPTNGVFAALASAVVICDAISACGVHR